MLVPIKTGTKIIITIMMLVIPTVKMLEKLFGTILKIKAGESDTQRMTGIKQLSRRK